MPSGLHANLFQKPFLAWRVFLIVPTLVVFPTPSSANSARSPHRTLPLEDNLLHRLPAGAFAFEAGPHVHPSDFAIRRANDQHDGVSLLLRVTSPALILDLEHLRAFAFAFLEVGIAGLELRIEPLPRGFRVLSPDPFGPANMRSRVPVLSITRMRTSTSQPRMEYSWDGGPGSGAAWVTGSRLRVTGGLTSRFRRVDAGWPRPVP